MNVVAILLGLTEGAINIYIQTRAILMKPVRPNMDTVFACMTVLVPLFAELILVFRVAAVYPPHKLSRLGRLGVYIPVATFKLARIANDIVFIARWAQFNRHSLNPLQTGQASWDLPNAKIEWFLQFFDTTYTSGLFLVRLQRSKTCQKKSGLSCAEPALVKGSSCLVAAHVGQADIRICTVALSSRIRTLFWIAVSNYMVPVVLNLAQLILAFRDPSFIHGSYIFIVNNYVQIIGVLLATIWATGTQFAESARQGVDVHPLVSEIRFVANNKNGTSPVSTYPGHLAGDISLGTEAGLEGSDMEGPVLAK
ncbi:hypothetical protein BN946_scf184868.g5 [Trametes cinnabarina]|uniref:Uncharacterized protein n=1 Tax=Pycnoporus cinnabarinus TaxID=5643 RepID=A0A060SQZ1_PYCCI|nr:hypothetical protein BN946_scf184868.g5 [Trametes cinnabarina]